MTAHKLFREGDFTAEEVARGNRLYQAVVLQNLSVCKRCGASTIDELAAPCGQPCVTNMDISTPRGLANAMTWQIAHIARMADGGVWCVPRSCSFYTISKATKTVVRTGLVPEPTIERVFAAMGWQVKEKEVTA